MDGILNNSILIDMLATEPVLRGGEAVKFTGTGRRGNEKKRGELGKGQDAGVVSRKMNFFNAKFKSIGDI